MEHTAKAYQEFFQRGKFALETYSNVHRGTGQFSQAATALYERAREEAYHYFGVSPKTHEVIFGSPAAIQRIKRKVARPNYESITASALGLSMGIAAIAVLRKALPKSRPEATGGGIVQLVTEEFVIWHNGAERYEVGTPPIMNAILLGIALQMIRTAGNPDLFNKKENAPAWDQILSNDALKELHGEALLAELQPQLVGHQVLVPTNNGQQRYVNLDGAASTPSFAPIWQTFCDTLQQPKSVHPKVIQQARSIVLDFFHASEETYDFVFACNTTEAINFAAQNLDAEGFKDITPVVINSLLDHHSNELPWRFLKNVKHERFPVDSEGFYDLTAIENLLISYNETQQHGKERIILIALNGASNVLGTFNDIHKVTELAHSYGVRVLVDGAQLSAHRGVNLTQLDVDYYAFSAHKIYSPFGSGGLFMRRGLLKLPHNSCHSGTTNTAGTAALAKSLDLLQRIGMQTIETFERGITEKALNELKQFPRVHLLGMTDTTTPQFAHKGPVISFEMQETPHNVFAKRLAEEGGVGTRNGCFCAHMMLISTMNIPRWRINISKALLNLGIKQIMGFIPGMVRISFGIENTAEDVTALAKTIAAVEKKHDSFINRALANAHTGTPFIRRTKTQKEIADFVKQRCLLVFPSETSDE